MTDATELRDNLDKALDDQRDALAASIDAAYKFGLKKGRDEQMTEVMRWFDENLSSYTDDSYLGDCHPLYRLGTDLKEAMRPTQEDS